MTTSSARFRRYARTAERLARLTDGAVLSYLEHFADEWDRMADHEPTTCPACDGAGEIVAGHTDPQEVTTTPCAWCEGEGEVPGRALDEWNRQKEDAMN